MNIPIGISNTHTATLYFKCEITSPPGDYSDADTNMGSIGAGLNAFLFFRPTRSFPALTNGEYNETLNFRLTAYTDAGYSSAYGYQDLSVTIHHFDHVDGSWTIINHTDFDDSTWGGWANAAPALAGCQCGILYLQSNTYLSPPNAAIVGPGVGANNHTEYNAGNTSGYSKLYFVIHWRKAANSASLGMSVQVNSTLIRDHGVNDGNYPPVLTWCREAFEIPRGASTIIKFGFYYSYDLCNMYVDELWIIAK